MPLITPPVMQYEDEAGIPLAFAEAYFTMTGTTTPVAMYQDAEITVPHPSPVVADDQGLFPAVFYDPSTGDVRCRIIVTGGTLVTPLIDVDPVTDADLDRYAQTFQVLGSPIDAAIVGIAPFPIDIRFKPDFGGIAGWVEDASLPTADVDFTVYKKSLEVPAGVIVGTITLSTAGVFTGDTSGIAVDFEAGTTMVIINQATADVTLADFAITLLGWVL